MRDLKRYWQDVRAIQASLPAFLWIVDDLGSLVEVTAEIAAKLLLGKTHRVATEEEIREHQAKIAATNLESARVEQRRRGTETVALK